MDDYSDYGVTTPEAISSALLVYVIILVFSLIFAAVLYVLISLPLSALFRKVGVEPWKAWVPFYSTYVWLQLGGQNGHWVWLSLVPYGGLVSSVFLYIGMHRTGIAFGKDTSFLVLGIFLPVVWLFILGFGKDEYHPERIGQLGLGSPLVGYGAPARPAVPFTPPTAS
jgi:hypothetical protein